MLLEVGVAGTPGRVARVVAGAEVAHAAEVRVLHVPVDDLGGVRLGEVDLADDAVRMPEPVGERLEPLRLLDRVLGPERGLDVDGLGDVLEARLADEVVGPVALRLDGPDVAEHRMRELGQEPDVLQVRVAQVREVDMGVDERELGHGVLLQLGVAATRILAPRGRWKRFLRLRRRPVAAGDPPGLSRTSSRRSPSRIARSSASSSSSSSGSTNSRATSRRWIGHGLREPGAPGVGQRDDDAAGVGVRACALGQGPRRRGGRPGGSCPSGSCSARAARSVMRSSPPPSASWTSASKSPSDRPVCSARSAASDRISEAWARRNARQARKATLVGIRAAPTRSSSRSGVGRRSEDTCICNYFG